MDGPLFLFDIIININAFKDKKRARHCRALFFSVSKNSLFIYYFDLNSLEELFGQKGHQ